jgi:hypothetical protein
LRRAFFGQPAGRRGRTKLEEVLMAKRFTNSNGSRASPPKPKQPSRPKVGWLKFLQAHPKLYTATFAKKTPPPKGKSLTVAVRHGLKSMVHGPWESMTLKENGATAVVVAFADKADFDAAKIHFNGQPWKSNVVGSVDGFQVTFP